MNTKTVVVMIIAILLLIVIIQNTQAATLKFFFWKINLPRIIILAVTLIIGFVTGYVTAGLGTGNRKVD